MIWLCDEFERSTPAKERLAEYDCGSLIEGKYSQYLCKKKTHQFQAFLEMNWGLRIKHILFPY